MANKKVLRHCYFTEFAIDGYRATFNNPNTLSIIVPKNLDLTNSLVTFNNNNLFLNSAPLTLGQKYNFNETSKRAMPLIIITDNGIKKYSLSILRGNPVQGGYMVENKIQFKKENSLNNNTVKELQITYHRSAVTQSEKSHIEFDVNKFDGNTLTLIFKSGLGLSTDVAQFFKDNTQNCSAYISSSYNDNPEKMNFAIATTLYINGSPVKDDFYIANGKAVGGKNNNNWWIGGSFVNIRKRCLYKTFAVKVETLDNQSYYIYYTEGSTLFTVSSENLCK